MCENFCRDSVKLLSNDSISNTYCFIKANYEILFKLYSCLFGHLMDIELIRYYNEFYVIYKCINRAINYRFNITY